MQRIFHITKIFAVFIIGFLLYKFIFDWIPNNGWHHKYNYHRTSEIFSLKTTSETTGSFILGIGSIGNQDYYIFYRRTSSGGLIREKLKTSDCILYEGYSQPKIIEIGTMGYRLEEGDTTATNFFNESSYSSGYNSIYIPKGTITERIDINLN